MKKSPLSDLSFFKFPDLTPEVVQNIVLVFILMAFTVLITVMVQRWIYTHSARDSQRKKKRHAEAGLPKTSRDVLARLLTFSDAVNVDMLLADSPVFEAAVDAMVASASEEELAELHKLRRSLRRNVMNPDETLISTRQLLAELPLRLMSNVKGERLDLYCDLLELDETHMLFDLFHDEEVFEVLRSYPHVRLVYWREGEEEVVFQITLEEVREGRVPLFRAKHATRDVVAGQRAEFRLSVDLPLVIHYIPREELKKGSVKSTHPRESEGRLLDISFGGASFYSQRPLPPHGFAQLQFELHDQPLRTMVEVTSSLAMGEGSYGGFLVRGQLRGLAGDARTRLHTFLTREQIRRLRDRQVFRFKTGS